MPLGRGWYVTRSGKVKKATSKSEVKKARTVEERDSVKNAYAEHRTATITPEQAKSLSKGRRVRREHRHRAVDVTKAKGTGRGMIEREKKEAITKEVRKMISEGKSTTEIAQAMKEKGIQIEITAPKFDEPDTALDRAEAIVKGRLVPTEKKDKDIFEKVEEPIKQAKEKLSEKRLKVMAEGDKATGLDRLKTALGLYGFGVATGMLTLAESGIEIGKVAATRGIPAAATTALLGTAEWFATLPRRTLTALRGDPFVAGQITGEVLGAEIAFRGAGKGFSKAKPYIMKASPLYVPPHRITSLMPFEHKPSTARVPIGTSATKIKEMLTSTEYKLSKRAEEVYHATSTLWTPESFLARLKGEYTVKPGTSPTKGLYVAGEAYPAFALSRRGIYEVGGINIDAKPNIVSIMTEGIELPKKADVGVAELALARELVGGRAQSAKVLKEFAEYKKWVEEHGERTKAYVSPEATAGVPWRGEIEVEAVIPEGAVLKESPSSRVLRRYTMFELPVKRLTRQGSKEFKEFQKTWEERFKKATEAEKESLMREYISQEAELLSRLEKEGKVKVVGKTHVTVPIRRMKVLEKITKKVEKGDVFDTVRRAERDYLLREPRAVRGITFRGILFPRARSLRVVRARGRGLGKLKLNIRLGRGAVNRERRTGSGIVADEIWRGFDEFVRDGRDRRGGDRDRGGIRRGRTSHVRLSRFGGGRGRLVSGRLTRGKLTRTRLGEIYERKEKSVGEMKGRRHKKEVAALADWLSVTVSQGLFGLKTKALVPVKSERMKLYSERFKSIGLGITFPTLELARTRKKTALDKLTWEGFKWTRGAS